MCIFLFNLLVKLNDLQQLSLKNPEFCSIGDNDSGLLADYAACRSKK